MQIPSKQTVMSLAGLFLRGDKLNKLPELYDRAVQLIQTAESPADAFKRSGLDPAVIDKAADKLDSGIAGTMLRALNADQKQVRGMLNQLKGMLAGQAPQVNLPSEKAPDGRLDELRRVLAQAKRA